MGGGATPQPDPTTFETEWCAKFDGGAAGDSYKDCVFYGLVDGAELTSSAQLNAIDASSKLYRIDGYPGCG